MNIERESFSTTAYLAQWQQNLVQHFSLSELQALCFGLGVQYEELGGDNTRGDKARELIAFMQRHGRLPELGAALQKARPHLDWDGQVPDGQACPYRGLSAFREQDAPLFFGREAFSQILAAQVQQEGLVAVVGPSGSGKSSVVFAGLVPLVRRRGTWLIVDLRPVGLSWESQSKS